MGSSPPGTFGTKLKYRLTLKRGREGGGRHPFQEASFYSSVWGKLFRFGFLILLSVKLYRYLFNL